ncbi:MAG: response regulator [Gammaproteobacteria bacterium]|nr:response regulator [Gammaproteobacteria bacterium]
MQEVEPTQSPEAPSGEGQLTSRLEEAERADRAKSRFLADVSHEIRTQLAGIIGMTQLTLETKLTPEQREYLGLSASSANALLTIVNDLLDLSKIEAGKLEIETEPFSLSDLLNDITALSAAQAEDQGIGFQLGVGADVPDVIKGDPGRIRQILLNLIGNALKFTQDGAVSVSVAADAIAGADHALHVQVRDSGPGIPAEQLSSIFEAYTQADGETAMHGNGTGLGLAICRQLVELMGGRIWAESSLGQGSSFHVIVPIGVYEGAARISEEGHSELEDLPVLVIAKNRFVREGYVDAIGAIGLTPVGVENATEAVGALGTAAATDHPFALAVVALNGDSLEFAAQLRQRADLEQMHIVVVTSVGQRGDAVRCRDLNIAGYLTRPLTDDVVQGAIQAVLTGPSPVDLSTLVTKHWLRERRRHLSLLVVDDSPTHRMVAKRILERRGHHVDVVDCGLDALKAVGEHRFDVILLDLWLPDIGGMEVAAEIRRGESARTRVPIIGTAAEGVVDMSSRVLRAGMDAFVAKPFQVVELLRTIESAVEDEAQTTAS